MKSILSGRSENDTVQDVYLRTRSAFMDASEFLHALDVLFVLGMLTIEEETGLIAYA
jgi:chloramphenicol 3-O-phosphotransferase